MGLSFLTAFFKKKKKSLFLPDSILTKKLKLITRANSLLIYENVKIYHHKDSYFIPLLILDPSRGIYIFEYKEWSYAELKNAKVEKAINQVSSTQTLAFDKAHSILRKRFNELTHNDGVPIYNYLLMENLNANEHKHLDVSFQELLPREKIIFSNSSYNDILKKLQKSIPPVSDLPSPQNIIGSILTQYCIVDKNLELKLSTKEQIEFINADLPSLSSLNAEIGSGATSSILLKTILEKLKNSDVMITIIKPTLLSCDIFKRNLLNTIERAIVEIDITNIEIITPTQLINRHLNKLSKKNILDNSIVIDKILMKRKIAIADILICDDGDYYPKEFIQYLKHIQKKSTLLIVTADTYKNSFTLPQSFRIEKQKITFIKTNPYAKTLQLISQLLQTHSAKDILIISSNLSKEKLNDDLKYFIKDKAILLDSSKNLIDQDIDNLLLAEYSDINGINAKFIILLDICDAQKEYLEYAFYLADEEVYVLYEEDTQAVLDLKESYENS